MVGFRNIVGLRFFACKTQFKTDTNKTAILQVTMISLISQLHNETQLPTLNFKLEKNHLLTLEMHSFCK